MFHNIMFKLHTIYDQKRHPIQNVHNKNSRHITTADALTLTTPSLLPVMITLCASHSIMVDMATHWIC